MEKAGEGLLACPVFAFDGGELQVRGDYLCLQQEFAPKGVGSDDLREFGSREFTQSRGCQ